MGPLEKDIVIPNSEPEPDPTAEAAVDAVDAVDGAAGAGVEAGAAAVAGVAPLPVIPGMAVPFGAAGAVFG
jgi:hypothetical protein